ncbi:MAG: DUF1508 domain-containing protein [Candidatus Falkowbacteria bacterium]
MAKFILKKDSQGDYYWILKSTNNGKIVAKSSESYETKTGAKDSVEWTRANAKNASLVDEA